MKKRSRRHFTLLEVLIAFLIVMLCFYPLIYPHTAILREQRFFIDKIKLDHLVTLVYGEVTENLYLNQYTWSDISNKTPFPVGAPTSLPFTGTYSFKVNKYKPKRKPEEELKEQPKYYVYLLDLDFSFQHKHRKDTEGKPYTKNYQYQITVVRDLEHGTGFQVEE